MENTKNHMTALDLFAYVVGFLGELNTQFYAVNTMPKHRSVTVQGYYNSETVVILQQKGFVFTSDSNGFMVSSMNIENDTIELRVVLT